MEKRDWEMALSVLNNLEISENTPHILIGISFAKEAVGKQMPKRPKIKKLNKITCFELRCPNDDCGAVLQSDSPCCRYCGQALDWCDTE